MEPRVMFYLFIAVSLLSIKFFVIPNAEDVKLVTVWGKILICDPENDPVPIPVPVVETPKPPPAIYLAVRNSVWESDSAWYCLVNWFICWRCAAKALVLWSKLCLLTSCSNEGETGRDPLWEWRTKSNISNMFFNYFSSTRSPFFVSTLSASCLVSVIIVSLIFSYSFFSNARQLFISKPRIISNFNSSYLFITLSLNFESPALIYLTSVARYSLLTYTLGLFFSCSSSCQMSWALVSRLSSLLLKIKNWSISFLSSSTSLVINRKRLLMLSISPYF